MPPLRTLGERYGNVLQALVVIALAVFASWKAAESKVGELSTRVAVLETRTNRVDTVLEQMRLCLEGIRGDVANIRERLARMEGNGDQRYRIKP